MKTDKKKIIILLIITLVISFAGITDIGNIFAGTVRTATVQPESKKTETGEKDKNKTKDKKKTKEGKKQKNKSKKRKKVWVPAVYKIVKHPAVKKQKISVHWVCQCGEVFNSDEEWQAHRPKP